MNVITILKKIRIFFLKAFRYTRERLGFLKRKCISPTVPQNKDGKVYVNLGCGVNTSSEFINVDARGFPHTHHIHNVTNLSMFPSDSVDLLYASHLLEHVPRGELIKTLKEWKRVLKKGGVLRFGVPDFDGLIEVYTLSGKDVKIIVNQLMGTDGEYDDHHTIWNEKYAREVLQEAGYKEVRRWDPKEVSHHDFTDKTMRTVCVEDKEVVISLNIETVK